MGGADLLTLVSQDWKGIGMASLFSWTWSREGGGGTGWGSSPLPLFRKPSQRANNHPSCLPGSLSDPCLHPVFELYACQAAQHSCISSQACSWVSKLQVLGTQADPLGEGLTTLLLFHSRKAVAWQGSNSEFMVKWGKKPAPRSASFSHCLLFLAREQRSTLVPPVLLSQRGHATHYQMHSKKRTVSPFSRGSSDHTAHSQVSLSSFPTGIRLSLPGKTMVMARPFKTSDFAIHRL